MPSLSHFACVLSVCTCVSDFVDDVEERRQGNGEEEDEATASLVFSQGHGEPQRWQMCDIFQFQSSSEQTPLLGILHPWGTPVLRRKRN